MEYIEPPSFDLLEKFIVMGWRDTSLAAKMIAENPDLLSKWYFDEYHKKYLRLLLVRIDDLVKHLDAPTGTRDKKLLKQQTGKKRFYHVNDPIWNNFKDWTVEEWEDQLIIWNYIGEQNYTTYDEYDHTTDDDMVADLRLAKELIKEHLEKKED